MQVLELWRYPVKSMRGERQKQVTLKKTGIEGDRNIVVVSQEDDRVITARTHPGLLGLQASFCSGVTLIEGHPWHSPQALALTRKAAGEPVRLYDAGEHPERFDILPLLVATDGAVQALGIDMRRLRPNIVISEIAGQAERGWPGSSLRSGEVVINVMQLRRRCVMTTYDPDTLRQDFDILRNIVENVGGKLALDCSVGSPGILAEGDPVSLDERPIDQERNLL